MCSEIADNDQRDLINEDDEHDETKIKARINFRGGFMHASYILYFAINSLLQLVTNTYLFERLSQINPLYNNITKERSSCGANASDPIYQAMLEIQKETALWLITFSTATGVCCSFTVLLYGAYSDTYGRRMLFALPNTGQMLKCVILGLNSHFSLGLHMLYAAFILDGISGFVPAIVVAAGTSVADSKTKYLSILMVVINFCSTVGTGVASVASGYLVTAFGYAITFYVCASVGALTYICIFLMPETNPATRERKTVLEYLKANFHFYYKKTPNNKRTIYLLLLVVLFFQQGITFSQQPLVQIAAIAEPFCMNSVELGQFAAITSFLQPILAMALMIPLQKFLSDSHVSAISILIMVGGSIMIGLANTTLLFYVGDLVIFPWVVVIALVRAIISKITPAHQQGAAQASLSSIGAITVMMSIALFNYIYEATLDIDRGIVFYAQAVVLSQCVILYTVVGAKIRKLNKNIELEVQTIHDDNESCEEAAGVYVIT